LQRKDHQERERELALQKQRETESRELKAIQEKRELEERQRERELQKQEELLLKQQQQKQELQQETRYDCPEGEPDAPNQRYDLPPEEEFDDNFESTGVTAMALYDYQAAADDEISFDPNDFITNIEMVDDGWWLGECHGKFGLFPANYVDIKQ